MKERNDGGIKCSEIVEILDDYVEGNLDAQTTHKIQVHLKSCENCANFGARYVALLGLLKEQGSSVLR